MPQYRLYSTGSNSHGQLGIDSTEDSSIHTRISLPHSSIDSIPLDLACGANHSLLLLKKYNGRTEVLGTGSDARGQLASQDRLEFAPIQFETILPHESNFEAQSIASCWETSFVSFRSTAGEDGTGRPRSDVLVSFGSNDWGERGALDRVGRSSVVCFDHLYDREEEVCRIEQLKAGPRHIIALLSISSISPSSERKVGAQDGADVRIRERRILVGWGAARHGQLGELDSSSSSTSSTSSAQPRAGVPTKLPRAISVPTIVQLPDPYTAADVVSFSCGRDHSAIHLRPSSSSDSTLDTTTTSSRTDLHDEAVLVLGSNKHGQLGLNPDTSGIAKTSRSNLITRTDLARFLSRSPPPSPSSPHTTITNVSTTWNSTFVAVNDSIVFSFGSNSHGQLGRHSDTFSTTANASPSPVPDFVAEGAEGGERRRIDRLVAGSEHVVSILRNTRSGLGDEGAETKELWTWGWNEHGNLGIADGDLTDRPKPVRLNLDNFVDQSKQTTSDTGEKEKGIVEKVWAGNATSWVLIRYN